MRSRSTAIAVGLLAWAAVPAAAQGPATDGAAVQSPPGVPAAEVDAVRAATEKYQDISVAIAEGYVMHPMCVVSGSEGAPQQLGAMGYHYFRPDMLGITQTEPRVDGTGTNTDFTHPSILVYEPQADGSLQLVAIENLVWVKAWQDAGHTEAPEYHGYQYYRMVDNPATPDVDEAHGFQPHYELHWWLYRDNPSGAFSPFNPAVNCDHADAVKMPTPQG